MVTKIGITQVFRLESHSCLDQREDDPVHDPWQKKPPHYAGRLLIGCFAFAAPSWGYSDWSRSVYYNILLLIQMREKKPTAA